MIESETYLEDLTYVATLPIFDKLKNKSVMITGACGLIGSFLVDAIMIHNKLYNDNITVIAYDFKEEFISNRFPKYLNDANFKYVCQDVNLPLSYDDEVDYIMHLASNAHPALFKTDPVGTIKANIIGLLNLLDFAKDKKVTRVLYTSTGEVYGEKEGIKEFHEEDIGFVNPVLYRSCYPNSKRCAETLCVSYSEQYGVSTVIARPSHVYGPTMTKSDSRVYAEFIRNILNNEDITLKSPGNQTRSYTYIADAVSALLYILLAGEDKNAYNIANPNSILSIREMAEIIAEIGNKKVLFDIPKDVPTNANPMQCGVLNSDKLQSIGWTPKYDSREGFINTIKILKEQNNGI